MNNEQLMAALTALADQLKEHRAERNRLVRKIIYPEGKLSNVMACIMEDIGVFVHNNALYILDDQCELVPCKFITEVQMLSVGQWEMMTADTFMVMRRNKEIKI